jgi:predicted ABC-type transport system involved in lysophospholipase L1 biosynthesis ATPase subunit
VRRRGHTLLLVTHSEQVAGFADRVLHLEDGRLSPGQGP